MPQSATRPDRPGTTLPTAPTGQTASTVIKERGLPAMWAGFPWRLFRQIVALTMFDKIQSELVPKLFPHAFAPVAPKEGETLTPKR